MAFVEVAVELPVRGLYHYALPDHLVAAAVPGARVVVPFGNRGVSGVVVRTAAGPPAGVDRVLPIDEVVDEEPQVGDELLALCLWIAEYYEAPPGEVLRAALPVGTRRTARPRVVLTTAGQGALEGQGGALPRRQRDLLAAVAAAGGSLEQRTLLRRAGSLAELAGLIGGGLLERTRFAEPPRMKARIERTAALARPPTEADQAALARAPRRRALVDALVAAGGPVDVAVLRAADPRASEHLRALAAAGLVELGTRRATGRRTVSALPGAVTPPQLNPHQRAALGEIQAALAARVFQPFLLWGITGSGKTEVYLHAIADTLAAGRGAVVLVPEISLTPQLAARFRARFGDQVAVLHSGLGDRERFDEWQRLRRGEARIALGARSAVFAPVADVGVIVVDEEHDGSFKQEEGVRYHARDVALVRAQRSGAACILGSATPALESFHAARAGRYRLLHLPERANPLPLPAVELIDLRAYRADGEAMLSAPLAEAIEQTLARGEQTILFLNRRGFSTFVLCKACGHAFRCRHCSVSLTYHRTRDRLMCHYCGHGEPVPVDCAECGAARSVVRRGIGTEQVADSVARRFPRARVARLDRDVASGASIEKVLARVARREVDILVGTQMVTKGHDFPAVTLVGVLCADTALSLPDFRAAERTFQLLTQVAGRAGRGDLPGRVLVQSWRTDATAVACAAQHDYERFFDAETGARAEFGYPPFGHLVAIRVDGPDAGAVEAAARTLARRAEAARARLPGVTLLGPSEAPLARLKGRTRWHLWLKAAERKELRRALHAVIAEPRPGSGDHGLAPSVRVGVDVDPVSAL